MQWGRRYIRSWSKTQATVALSSAEAELQGRVKAGAESMGIEIMMADMGLEPGGKSVIYADAAAALGVAARKGAGKTRHLDVRILCGFCGSRRRTSRTA